MKKLRIVIVALIISNVLFAQREIAFLETNIPGKDYVNTNASAQEVSFEIINGLIVISGQLEGQDGSFILDTGAPGLIVNEEAEADPELEARSIGGTVAVSHRTVSQLNWAGISMEEVEGYAINMEHLEASIDRNLLGLLGFDLLQEYEILIDYKSSTIFLLPLNNYLHKYSKPRLAVDFRMEQHLPVIQLKVGRKKLNFGLDCGASINLIHEKYKDKLVNFIDQECCLGYLRGLDGTGELSTIVTFDQVKVGKEMVEGGEFQWTAFQGLSNQGISIDGLLGASFFKSHRISINYDTGKVYVW
ncbi:MAG: hypothetical protein GYB31_01375 [Bacteroidetes bacterium]|nr:hypothetical protein [Bacteroidota bacterium]